MPRKTTPKRRSYATDLTDGQWVLIEPMIPRAVPGGRPRKATMRDLVDAILYLLRAGGGWRLLPHDRSPWQTVYYYLRRWQRKGVLDRVHHALVMADRERVGREASSSAAILDGQSVRTADRKGARKASTLARNQRRKRHILTDTYGRLLAVHVHGADIRTATAVKAS